VSDPLPATLPAASAAPSTALATIDPAAGAAPSAPAIALLDPSIPDHLREALAANLRASRADNTVTAYASDVRHFAAWCAAEGQTFNPGDSTQGVAFQPATPVTVASYITDIAEGGPDRAPLSVSTIGRRLAAIAAVHDHHGYLSPTKHPLVVQARGGIANRKGTAPKRKRAITTANVRAAIAGMGDRVIDLRDRALLLVGYGGGFRRGELSALDVGHVEITEGVGVRVWVARSKTDQAGEGRWVSIECGENPDTCPVEALTAWLDHLAAAGITTGALFRQVDRHGTAGERLGGKGVARVVKRHMARIGLDADDFAGHSLRRGLATTAARGGASDRTIMASTRHAKVDSLTPYVEEGRAFHDTASRYLGL
jgi:site-specific recombinase XerD